MVKRRPKKKRSPSPQEILQKLTLRDRVIYSMLVDTRYCCTQTTVAKELNLAKSTVSDITNRLAAAKVIYKYAGDKQNIIYRKGINHCIIDEHLKIDIESGDYKRFINHQVVTIRPPKEPHQDLWRMHLSNGGWIDISVENEGALDSFIQNGLKISLFGNTPPNDRMRGLLKWDGRILTDQGWFPIRYQKGINTGTKTFGICPKGILINGSNANVPKEDSLEIFYRIITPIFNSMEKYGGWKFGKDSDGNYLFRSKASPEFGADPYVTKIMTGFRGEMFGIPGVTKDWYDRSEDACGPGEYETGDPELVEAISSLPTTHSMVRKHDDKIAELNSKCDDLAERVETIENTLKKEEK